jgi:hypothetical protein
MCLPTNAEDGEVIEAGLGAGVILPGNQWTGPLECVNAAAEDITVDLISDLTR